MTTDEIRGLSPYRIANESDVTGPDSPESPGAKFLKLVAYAFAESLDYEREHNGPIEVKDWIANAAHEIADGAVPIYTGEKWRVFIDLAAYGEDLDDLGGSTGDMDADAVRALYIIAERVVMTLADMVVDDEDDEEDDEEDDDAASA